LRNCIKQYGIHIYIGRLALLAILSAGWWGLLYPNFGTAGDIFQAVGEEENDDSVTNPSEDFYEMLEAKPGELQVKSALLEKIFGEKETKRGKENGSECTDRGV